MKEMKLVEKRHGLNTKQSSSEEINWNQVMAYFKGKAQGALAGVNFESQSHHKSIVAAGKLFETQMAGFIKAYRDQ